ncbi:MAG: hypothetical protein RLZZ550_383 [Verrucomicrobiota bacterium]|jgi:hypothetical protein
MTRCLAYLACSAAAFAAEVAAPSAPKSAPAASVPALPAPPLAKADAAALVALIKELNEAMGRGDPEPIIKHTHPAILQLAGSRQKFEEAVRASVKAFAGFRFEDCVVGEPSAPVRAGDQEIVFVPLVLVMRIEKNRVRSEGFMVGIRTVGTTAWACLDGSGFAKQPALFAKVFPGLPADLKLPPSKVELLK